MQIEIQNETYEAKRFGLRKWLELEEVKQNIQRAIQHRNRSDLSHQIFVYVGMALSISPDILTDIPYQDVLSAFNDISSLNSLSVDLPFMQIQKKRVDAELPYDYPNRLWWIWAHQLAKDFGWTLDYIEELDPNNAACLYQEHLIRDYFDREWQWMCSQNSVGYDSTSKKSKYNPLPKPFWMYPKPVPPKKVKMLKSMVPSGIIVRLPDAKSE